MKRAIQCTCFALILIVILTYVSSVLSFKGGDSTYCMTKFYDQDEDTVDVLVLGSSHAFMDINPAILWEEFGIASYDLCGSIQPMWSSYHYLVEALKTQHPRLIVLEGLCLYPRDMYEQFVIVSNNYGLKWSRNRIEALRNSTVSREFADYLIEFNQSHGRYSDLSEADFRTDQGNPLYANWKGFTYTTFVAEFDRPDLSNITEGMELDTRIETYYRKILELARDKGIPLAVVISPYVIVTEESQQTYNRAAEIAAEYGVSFYNFNLDYDRCDLDFDTDFAEDGSHLNYLGAAKYTRALGETLIQDYPDSYIDRRGDGHYASWARNSEYYERMIWNLQFGQADSIPAAVALAKDEDYIVILAISEENEESEALCSSLQDIGVALDAHSGVWTWTGGSTSPERVTGFPMHIEMVEYDDLLITSDGGEYRLLLDGNDYTKAPGGTSLIIYDQKTASVVAVMN